MHVLLGASVCELGFPQLSFGRVGFIQRACGEIEIYAQELEAVL